MIADGKIGRMPPGCCFSQKSSPFRLTIKAEKQGESESHRMPQNIPNGQKMGLAF